jgi:hypothetical protein
MNAGSQAEIAEKAQARIPASGELETAADSKASVRAADGLQIDLDGRTRVALDQLQPKSRQLKLLTGSIRCAVPHQLHSQPFQVLTPDVTITDLGTVFTVSVDGPTHATRVTVQEGEVMVRNAAGESRVSAPGSWSSTAAMTPPTPTAASPEPASTPLGSARTSGATSAPRPPRNEGPRNQAPRNDDTLNEEAQLLRQGLAAERLGHFAEARASLSTLLRTYPHSSLVPDARAALERVEARQKP